MLATIALVGRPNVGKSTLFNRLTRSRDALVANYSGLTRDRKYGEYSVGDRRFIVVDTGGISGEEDGIDSEMAEQSRLAIDEADLVLLLVDSREGLCAADFTLAEHIRKKNKHAILVANKIDGLDELVATSQFYELGLNSLVGIAASQGRGINGLAEKIVNALPAEETDAAAESDLESGIKIAVVGRPECG